MHIVVSSETSERGSDTPIEGYKEFTNNPVNIRIVRLKPTEYNKVSVMFDVLSNLRTL